MFEYKISEEDKAKGITRDSIIEKRGHVIRFSLNQLEANHAQLAKTRKEIDAQMQYERAKIANIESFHPFVKELTEEQLSTVDIYSTAKNIEKQCVEKLKEIDDYVSNDTVEIADIKKQIPELDMPEISKEENIVDVANAIAEKSQGNA